MRQQYDDFLRASLNEMNFSTDVLDEQTPLGLDGLDIDSLAASELAMRVSDAYAVTLPPEDVMGFPDLTYGELIDVLTLRIGRDAQA